MPFVKPLSAVPPAVYKILSPVLKPCPAEVKVVDDPPTALVSIVFEFDLTNTPIGAVFSSIVI